MGRVFAVLLVLAAAFFAPAKGWNWATATFYGGANAAGTMGKCGSTSHLVLTNVVFRRHQNLAAAN
jgi:hypothetical protein